MSETLILESNKRPKEEICLEEDEYEAYKETMKKFELSEGDSFSKSELPLKISQDGKRKVEYVGPYVGFFRIGSRTVRIDPRGKDKGINHFLCLGYLLHKNNKIKIHYANQSFNSDDIKKDPNFIDIIAYSFIDQTEKICKNGLVKTYTKQTDESSIIRGKVRWNKGFKKGYFPTEKLFHERSVLTSNTLENQVLKTALDRLRLMAHSDIGKRSSFLLNKYFFGINNLEKIDYNKKINFTPINFHYKSSIHLSRFILRSFVPEFEIDKERFRVQAMLFDVNELFEYFIIEFLKEHLDFRNTHQILVDKWKKFNRGEVNVKPSGWIIPEDKPRVLVSFLEKPDIIIMKNDGNYEQSLIIDAKNKILQSEEGRKRPTVKDMRQILVYCTFHQPSKNGILLYPDIGDGKNEYADFQKGVFPIFGDNPEKNMEINIYAKTIALSGDVQEVYESVHGFLDSLIKEFPFLEKDSTIQKNQGCNCSLGQLYKRQMVNTVVV